MLLQKIEKLREECKIKFKLQGDNQSNDGVKIAFKLSDGSKTEYVFSKISTVKVRFYLYMK